MTNQSGQERAGVQAVSTRFLDFWLLGGTSGVLFLVMAVGSFYRESSPIVQQKFMLIGPFFGVLSIVCNNPHFIASYRFGYSRGLPFIFQNFIALILVPLLLIVLNITAYLHFDADVSQNWFVQIFNQELEFAGLDFRFGKSATFGRELIGLSIWIMYLTVGWHYSKQIYGCMMVYSRFDQYHLSENQKRIIRYSLLFLALFQFLSISDLMDQFSVGGYQDPRFFGIQILPLGLPHCFFTISKILAISSFAAVVGILIKKYISAKKVPTATFLVAWLSIYLWWIQCTNLPEFYYLAVPFFHSLQYLPFAAKMEQKNIPQNKWFNLQLSFRILALLLIGFLFFELIPYSLDRYLDTEVSKTAWFFVTSFAVFINIHHFFIDSVVWRLNQKQVKSGLFDE